MPAPLLILGALALAGGGAYLALRGGGGPKVSATGSPATSGLTAAAPAKAQTKKNTTRKKFSAATGPLPAGGSGTPKRENLPPAARYALMRDYLNAAKAFEKAYDTAKDREGVGLVKNQLGAGLDFVGGVLSLGLAGDIEGGAKDAFKNVAEAVGGGADKASLYRGYETAAARAAELAQVPPDTRAKTVHHGEEYAWTRYVIIVPGYGLLTT